MITKAMRRTIGAVLWPVSRPLMLALLWTQRDTIALWWRSLSAELRRDGALDVRRMGTLVRALWRVTADQRLRDLGRIDTISVDGAFTGAGLDPGARAAALRATLRDIPGVVSVEVVDAAATAPVAA